MRAVLIGADVIQSHFLFSATCLSLEKDSFTMTAFGARMIFGARKCWVGNDIGNYVSQLARRFHVNCLSVCNCNKLNLLDFVHDFVHINTVTVSFGFVVTVSTCIQQDFVFLVLFGVKHVVAFLGQIGVLLLIEITLRLKMDSLDSRVINNANLFH